MPRTWLPFSETDDKETRWLQAAAFAPDVSEVASASSITPSAAGFWTKMFPCSNASQQQFERRLKPEYNKLKIKEAREYGVVIVCMVEQERKLHVRIQKF